MDDFIFSNCGNNFLVEIFSVYSYAVIPYWFYIDWLGYDFKNILIKLLNEFFAAMCKTVFYSLSIASIFPFDSNTNLAILTLFFYAAIWRGVYNLSVWELISAPCFKSSITASYEFSWTAKCNAVQLFSPLELTAAGKSYFLFNDFLIKLTLFF